MATKKRKPVLSRAQKKENSLMAEALAMYAAHEADLYRNQARYIAKALARRKVKGEYKKELAIKAFKSLADDAAKKYNRRFSGRFGSGFGEWKPDIRREAAKILLGHYAELIRDYTQDLRAGIPYSKLLD